MEGTVYRTNKMVLATSMKPFHFIFNIHSKFDIIDILDVSKSALVGKSLVAYTAFAQRDWYQYYGSKCNDYPKANCQLVVASNSIDIQTIKTINPNEELMFANNALYNSVEPIISIGTSLLYPGFYINQCISVLQSTISANRVLQVRNYINTLWTQYNENIFKAVFTTEENIDLYPGHILSCSPTSMGFPDVSRILTKNYANDNIINFWIELLRQLDRKMMRKNPLRKTTLFIDSLEGLLNKVSESKWEDIIYFRINLYRKNGGKKFVDYDRIVIPDKEEDQFHWVMYVIYLQQKSIVYFNSLNVAKANKNPCLLLTFLEKMCQIDNVYFDMKDWNIILAECPYKQVLYYYI